MHHDLGSGHLGELEKLIDEQLTKADPFMDDFVPDEFTGGFVAPTGYMGGGNSAARRLYGQPTFNVVSKRKRVPRDVDSNVADAEDKGAEGLGGGETIPEAEEEPVDIVEERNDDEDEVEKEDLIQVIRNNVTMNMVLEDLAADESTSDATTTIATAEPEITTTTISTSTTATTATTLGGGGRGPSAPPPSHSDSIRWLREQIGTLWARTDLGDGDRRLLRLFNSTLSLSEEDPGRTSNRQLLDLTVKLIMLTQRLNEQQRRKASTSDGAAAADSGDDEEGEAGVDGERVDGKEQVEVAVEGEEEATTESPEEEECKNLQKLKILPEDSAEEVRRKYGTNTLTSRLFFHNYFLYYFY